MLGSPSQRPYGHWIPSSALSAQEIPDELRGIPVGQPAFTVVVPWRWRREFDEALKAH
jgi:hypothetical protein